MKNKNKGMTIIETLIALVVVAIAIIGILSGIYQSDRFNTMAKNRLKADQIAESKMEELRNMNYSDILSGSPAGNSLPDGTTTVLVTEQTEGKVVKVTVDWTKMGNGPAEELVTLIRKR